MYCVFFPSFSMTLKFVKQIDAHVGGVNDLAFSNPNKQLCVITCGDDKTIKVGFFFLSYLGHLRNGRGLFLLKTFFFFSFLMLLGLGCWQWCQTIYI